MVLPVLTKRRDFMRGRCFNHRANGEIGHGLIRYLAEQNCPIVTLDVNH